MKFFAKTFVALLLILEPMVLLAGPSSENFIIFDAFIYKNKPVLKEHGLSPIKVIYAGELWDKDEDRDEPNLERIAQLAEETRIFPYVSIDIEHWPVKGAATIVKDSIAKYRAVAEAYKKANNVSTIGFYGVPPIRDYWRAIGAKGEEEYSQWVGENAVLKPIAESIDVIFPSLYTFYSDPESWKKYAIENLKEAKKYGKPVYAFLWPMYHDSSSLKGTYISRDFWRLQLDTCARYANGVVLWGGFQEEWDENANWWIETKDFIKDLNRNPVDAPKNLKIKSMD